MRIITGMHRSGTSLVAGLIQAAGADLGDPASFHPADRWNPAGYYEQTAIHAVNMPLIHGRLGRASYLKLPSEASISRRAERLAPLIRATAAEYDERVVKDCRFCLTVPAWVAHGARIDSVVVCLRNPRAVAMSLRRRNKLPLRLGFDLWYEHNSRLLEAVSEVPTWLVDYDQLFDAEGFSLQMEGALDVFEVPTTRPALSDMAQEFVKPQLRHNRPADVRCPSKVERLWRVMLDMHTAQFETSTTPEIGA